MKYNATWKIVNMGFKNNWDMSTNNLLSIYFSITTVWPEKKKKNL